MAKKREKQGNRPVLPQVTGAAETLPVIVTQRQEGLIPRGGDGSRPAPIWASVSLPILLREYEAIHPGLADRIVAMTESEGEHRRRMQRDFLRLSGWGLAASFSLAMVTLLCGFGLIYEGKNLEGMSSMILAVGSLAGLFLLRGRSPRSPSTNGEEGG